MLSTPAPDAPRDATARGLLGDQLWASWGPPLVTGSRWQTDRVIGFVARSVDRPVDEVAKLLLAAPNRCRYILLRQLAATRHSVVYAGVDRRLAREVAIKIHHNKDEHTARQVMVEARANSGVEHPNIVRIYDIGEHDQWLFSVSELCDCDLQTWCVKAQWPEILARIIEAGAGLAHVHAAGYVHGDIKPLNILVLRDVAKLGDFGNAGEPGRSLRFGGTAGFIAPEVATGHRTAASDVFALAVTAWACLFGTLPFGQPDGTAQVAIAVGVQRAIDGDIDVPQAVPPGMPGAVLGLLRRALNPDPNQRPALDQWLADLQNLHPSVTTASKWLRGLLVLTVAALVAAVAVLAVPGGPPEPGWIGDLVDAWAAERAVGLAARGDSGGALQLLEDAEARTRDQAKSRMLALACERVALLLEAHELLDDAIFAWGLSTRFARDAGDHELAARSMAGMRRVAAATVPHLGNR